MAAEQTPKIRPINDGEQADCAQIYGDAWNSVLPRSPRKIDQATFRAETEGELVLVATLDQRVRGYLSLWEPDWFIHHLYVAPADHRLGIGTSLLSAVIQQATDHPLSLKCKLANKSAIRFYKALGFQETVERGTDQYGDWIRLSRIPHT